MVDHSVFVGDFFFWGLEFPVFWTIRVDIVPFLKFI
jgi:hypothetical protein